MDELGLSLTLRPWLLYWAKYNDWVVVHMTIIYNHEVKNNNYYLDFI